MSAVDATPASHLMHTHLPAVARLALLAQRLLDADLLREEEGAALLAEAEAARQGLEENDAGAARRHVERVALLTEALVRTDALTRSDSQALLGAGNGILHPATGGED